MRKIADNLRKIADALDGFADLAATAGEGPHHRDPLEEINDQLHGVTSEIGRLGGPGDHSELYERIAAHFQKIAGTIKSMADK
jgi:hypothetical protein